MTEQLPTAHAESTRTILVTGATGVVGQALLRRLRRTPSIDVVALVRRTPVAAGLARSVPGDITRPRLGIDDPHYGELLRTVDAVVHAAATVDFNRPDDSISATNVEGVRHVLDFAARAGVPLYHVSTAYADAQEVDEHGSVGVRYAKSKKHGEKLVQSSGLPHVIIKPSIVIGDSRTGEVASFQALYQVADKLRRGHLAVFPFEADARVDLIPCDVVADSIAILLERRVTDGRYWVTNGPDALTVAEVIGAIVDYCARTGEPHPMPRFHSGAALTRLLDSLPPSPRSMRARKNAAWLASYFGAYVPPDSWLPSSRSELVELGGEWFAGPADSLQAGLRYWGRANGYAESAVPSPIGAG